MFFILPCLLAITFSIATLAHHKYGRNLFFPSRSASFTCVVFVLLILQIVGRFFILLELVHFNFEIEYVLSDFHRNSNGFKALVDTLYVVTFTLLLALVT